MRITRNLKRGYISKADKEYIVKSIRTIDNLQKQIDASNAELTKLVEKYPQVYIHDIVIKNDELNQEKQNEMYKLAEKLVEIANGKLTIADTTKVVWFDRQGLFKYVVKTA